MVKRKIIKIDDEKCNGCGLCIPNCPEGAIQMIDGKARLISDLFCDGLGACIGHCPEGAIEIEEREAEPYEEKKVMENIVKAGPNTVKAHLEHLEEHGEKGYLKEALEYLGENGINIPDYGNKTPCAGGMGGGCPGSRVLEFTDSGNTDGDESGARSSQLRQWPVQLHLVPPQAPYFQGKDVVLAADCVAYALADFHKDYLKGKGLAIACPKLDSDQEIYLDKIKSMIDGSNINTLTVMTMEVPCCGGLLYMAEKAVEESERKVPLKHVMISVQGEILSEEWITK